MFDPRLHGSLCQIWVGEEIEKDLDCSDVGQLDRTLHQEVGSLRTVSTSERVSNKREWKKKI